MITIRCIAESNIESGLIRYWTWDKYSHVEFVLPEGYLGSRLSGGIQIRPFDYIKVSLEAILTLTLPTEAEDKILSWAKDQIGESYGWKDVVDEAVHEDILKPSSMDCSHFVSKALSMGGIMVTRKRFFQNTPADVYNCTGLMLAKEG